MLWQVSSSLKFIASATPKLDNGFHFPGPTAMSVAISPLPGVKIIGWSMVESAKESMIWNDRPVYFVAFILGSREFYYQDYPFSVSIEIPQTWSEPYYFDVGFGAHFIHMEETKTPQFVNFTDAFPAWTNVQNWTSYYAAYQY